MLLDAQTPDTQEEIMTSETPFCLHAPFSEQNNAGKTFQQLVAHGCSF